jgi:membrane protease YdiL (CAAX protease family)
MDLTGHLLLAAPVFLFYHLGLLISPQAANGVDVFTRSLGYLAGLSWPVYLAVVLGLTAAYALAFRVLASKHRIDAKRFPLVLMEAGLYALLMGPVAGLLLSKLHVLGALLEQMGPLDRVVASAGAGFYEELVFRLFGLGALLWLLTKQGLKRWLSVGLAVLVTSLIFSAVHYVGPGSDAFDLGSFAYRFVLGAFLAAIFLTRGFATAVWAHALYDVYVMVILMG